MAILEENDILFAHKALSLYPGLTDASRRVGAAIIDHFNKRTGQCDPSIQRLATMLGIGQASVSRATEKLHNLGLIEKLSHGGKSHRSRYVPNWERFHAVVADWDARMKTGEKPASPCRHTGTPADTPAPNLSGLRSSTYQDCEVELIRIDKQTLRINPSKEPIETERVETPHSKAPAQSVPKARQGLGRGSKPIAQRPMLLPISGGKNVSHIEAARAAAERRWDAAAKDLGVAAYGEIIDWMDPLRQEAATQAELRRKGGGIAYIIDAMQGQRMRGNA